jgi:tRNA threonylcarbamoyladenosine biosynthesis protein TsaE
MSESADNMGNAIRAEIFTDSPDRTEAVGEALATRLRAGDVICLEGPLGSGKTCFVRGMARGLKIDPAEVSSPTFVIAHEYTGGAATLAHVDAYRLSGPEELETIGWHELLNSNVILAVEWPSRIQTALPPERVEVVLSHAGPQARQILIHAPGSMSDRLAGLPGAGKPQHACRTCGKSIDESSPSFPFCSNRCRLADLGSWFSGGYRMIRPVQADDELSE